MIAIAGDLPAWETAIATQLEINSPAAVGARQAAVAPHTWDARTETLSKYLAEALENKYQQSGQRR